MALEHDLLDAIEKLKDKGFEPDRIIVSWAAMRDHLRERYRMGPLMVPMMLFGCEVLASVGQEDDVLTITEERNIFRLNPGIVLLDPAMVLHVEMPGWKQSLEVHINGVRLEGIVPMKYQTTPEPPSLN